MERMGEKLMKVVKKIKKSMGEKKVKMKMEIGDEENLKGVVEMVKMKDIKWKEDEKGVKLE